MRRDENNSLYLRRQFLLTHDYISEFNKWQHLLVGDVHLHAHPDLIIIMIKNKLITLILLLFYPTRPEKIKLNIMSNVISKVKIFRNLVAAISLLTRCHALLFKVESVFINVDA
jgi:hypothetical protein